MRYRKKPVVVNAYVLCPENMLHLTWWCGGSIKGVALPEKDRVIAIETLEGEMRAEVGDYIIQGVEGEFYPCKPNIFKKTYEEVKNAS